MCQLEEQWFVLTNDTLTEALQMSPANNNQAFVPPPSSDALINFVLKILWGIIKRANIDYAERIWEEFTQSIHKFIEDKRNLSWHTTGKKKATLIVILSIWFTKLIIHHLQRRQRFHPRPDSPLHLHNEEPVLGYLKFSAKGTKREVFGMHIPGSLITTDIQEASYYQEYLENVAKHRRYLASKTGSNQDSPAPKPTKPARKPKSTAPPRPVVSTPVTSAQHAPTSASGKPQEKKHKHATETFDKPPKVKKSKYGVIGSLPLVIREPESGKYQPLPEVPGKGKAKSDSEEESEKVVLRAGEGGQDEGQARPDPGTQAEGQTGSDAGAQDEGQAGSNPDENSDGQVGPDPSNAGDDIQSIPSPVVHAGSDREHMDLDVADVSSQPSTEQLDEGFIATTYPKVQENLKLTVKEHVLLEEPASSLGTLSSLQHLSKDMSFGDLFFSDKPSDTDKNAKTKVESMVNVPI
uniref:Histone deacetylase 14 n=1 Tax=Tanacetum cinerariifolium TaxID=118510 RepID=A0A699ILT9_TANCI|nr:histone deacetylase 14 [Tanacetum cinerariifolium]